MYTVVWTQPQLRDLWACTLPLVLSEPRRYCLLLPSLSRQHCWSEAQAAVLEGSAKLWDVSLHLAPCVKCVPNSRRCATCSANPISLPALPATGAKSWNTARTYPRSPSSSSLWTKHSLLSCGRCTVLLITRQLTSWRRLSLWTTTAMKVSSAAAELQNTGRLFNVLKPHGGVVPFGSGDAAGGTWCEVVGVLADAPVFSSFCSKKGSGSN